MALNKHQEAWFDYLEKVEELYEEIVTAAKVIEDDDSDQLILDGWEWCEENDIPETMFAHAVQFDDEWKRVLDWAQSPMYPWYVGDDDE